MEVGGRYSDVQLAENNSVENMTMLNTNYSATQFACEILADYAHACALSQSELFALTASVMCIGTFILAYFLKRLRNSKYFNRTARRALGDFGLVTSIFLMVLVDYFVIHDTFTDKLEMPDPANLTHRALRNWVIHPLGNNGGMGSNSGINPPENNGGINGSDTTSGSDAYVAGSGTSPWLNAGHVFLAAVPAFLLFLIVFIETELTEYILEQPERRVVKGSGYHLDLFVIGLLSTLCALFGMPILAAAPVRTIAHWSALCVYSNERVLPGEKPRLTGVLEQRVTGLAVHVLIGLCAFAGPLLRLVPVAVLLGVFMYIGVSSMSGIQFVDRIKLMLIPPKHHPDQPYVKGVSYLQFTRIHS